MMLMFLNIETAVKKGEFRNPPGIANRVGTLATRGYAKTMTKTVSTLNAI